MCLTAEGLRLCDQRHGVLRKKLRGADPEAPAKPKWMRWKTYDAHIEKLDRLDERMNGSLLKLIAQLGGVGA